ncbi:MFS transporter [Uliginosibacterium sp. H3]|uniref:MFS transporter n=1 Tax=Uliginosibacterium silvisoli TaxID=3114758 RepID=A0ABU6K231_9RHOO|nr:MFS transporter [Uliginosibacterium sp. H3]
MGMKAGNALAVDDITAGSNVRNSRWPLASLCAATLLASLGTSIANVGLPTLAHAFGASFQAVQWVVLAYLLAITTLIVGVGRLGDMLGRRRVLLVGLASFTLASALCGLAGSLGMLIAARVAQGLGAAAMMALTLAFVADTVPKEKTGSAMGLLATMSAIGTALGPSLGGMLISIADWRALFFVNVPFAVLAGGLAWRYLPRDPARSAAAHTRFDFAGTLLLVLTLGAYALAMTLGRGHFGLLNVALVLAAVVGVMSFVSVERRVTAPLIQLEMFRNAVLRKGLIASMLVMTVIITTLVVGPFYLSRGLGLDAATLGIVMSCAPATVALCGVPCGRLVDRLGAQRMGLLGLAGVSAGCVLLAVLPTRWGVPAYVLPLIVVAFHYALFQAANNTAVMKDVAPKQRGATSGLLNLSRNLGLITGASLMGAVFSFASNADDITIASADAVAMGMRVTFAVAAVLVGAAFVVSLRYLTPASMVAGQVK